MGFGRQLIAPQRRMRTPFANINWNTLSVGVMHWRTRDTDIMLQPSEHTHTHTRNRIQTMEPHAEPWVQSRYLINTEGFGQGETHANGPPARRTNMVMSMYVRSHYFSPWVVGVLVFRIIRHTHKAGLCSHVEQCDNTKKRWWDCTVSWNIVQHLGITHVWAVRAESAFLVHKSVLWTFPS